MSRCAIAIRNVLKASSVFEVRFGTSVFHSGDGDGGGDGYDDDK